MEAISALDMLIASSDIAMDESGGLETINDEQSTYSVQSNYMLWTSALSA